MAATRNNPFKLIRGSLTVAACAAIGTAQAGVVRDTEIESAVLMYSEPNRVSALEAVVAAHTLFSGDRTFNVKFVYDALTGASANGSVPGASVQTFTRPSGLGSYQVQPGVTPLDDTFRDARVAVSGDYTHPLNRLTRLTGGVYGSGEHDYASLGGNASLARDFNKKNTTFSAGFSYSRDTVTPEGGRPVPFASMAPAGIEKPRLQGDGSKNVSDLVLGLTQVLDRATLAQLNYSVSAVSGYQTDPYKMISLVDPLTGVAVDQLFEHRPDNRTKHILHGLIKRHLSRDIVDLSYRFMTDDWGIQSHTVDLKYRLELGGEQYLRPHLRFYRQGAADFHAFWLDDGAETPEFATADYRLGDMTAWTFGLQHGRTLDNGNSLTVRLEYYRQSGDASPNAPGDLAGYDLFPTVTAWFAQIGYSFGI